MNKGTEVKKKEGGRWRKGMAEEEPESVVG